MASLVMPGRRASGSVKRLRRTSRFAGSARPAKLNWCFCLAVAVKLVWTSKRSMSQTTSRGGFSEILAVEKELVVGRVEVFVFAFVLPTEVAAHPDVGPTVAALGFLDAALEGVPLAVGIGGGRFRLVEQVAEVEEMLLAGAPLGEIDLLPLGDELLRSHAKSVWAAGGR